MKHNEQPNCVEVEPHVGAFFWLINWVNSFIIIAFSPNLSNHAGINPEVSQ